MLELLIFAGMKDLIPVDRECLAPGRTEGRLKMEIFQKQTQYRVYADEITLNAGTIKY